MSSKNDAALSSIRTITEVLTFYAQSLIVNRADLDRPVFAEPQVNPHSYESKSSILTASLKAS